MCGLRKGNRIIGVHSSMSNWGHGILVLVLHLQFCQCPHGKVMLVYKHSYYLPPPHHVHSHVPTLVLSHCSVPLIL